MAQNREAGGSFDLDMRFTTFEVGGSRFCIDIAHVREIVVCPKPCRKNWLPDFVDGYVLLRGLRVPVFDLRRIFGAAVVFGAGVRVIITSVNGRIAGLIVDSVTDVELSGVDERELQVSHQAQDADAPWSRFTGAVLVSHDGGEIFMIDSAKLFGPAEAAFLDSTLPSDPCAQ